MKEAGEEAAALGGTKRYPSGISVNWETSALYWHPFPVCQLHWAEPLYRNSTCSKADYTTLSWPSYSIGSSFHLLLPSLPWVQPKLPEMPHVKASTSVPIKQTSFLEAQFLFYGENIPLLVVKTSLPSRYYLAPNTCLVLQTLEDDTLN